MISFDAGSPAPALPRRLQTLVHDAAGSPQAALDLAEQVAEELGPPGAGSTRRVWEGLATVGAIDLTVARAIEPHLDALAILGQARDMDLGVDVPRESRWGVFAAEGPAARLTASQRPDGGWRLSGIKPWCSLARVLSHALITAWTSEHGRTLFAVDLRQPGVKAAPSSWHATGLAGVETGSLEFSDAAARPVGHEGWYLERPGFTWGAIGVAAIWWGGATGIARRLARDCQAPEPDQAALVALATCDTRLHAAGLALALAARDVDAATPSHATRHAWAGALRVRAIVHDACEATLSAAAHALGPAPLTQESDHARRVADLQVYLRQHHPARDGKALGRGLADGLNAAWGHA